MTTSITEINKAIEIIKDCQAKLETINSDLINTVGISDFCEHMDDIIADLESELSDYESEPITTKNNNTNLIMTQQETTKSMFTSNLNKGFTMGFANGLVISVQWGSMNYCERKSLNVDYRAEMKQDTVQSRTAEIAIWNLDSDWFDFGNDTVKGWCTADEVANWITVVSTVKDLTQLRNDAIMAGMIETEQNQQ